MSTPADMHAASIEILSNALGEDVEFFRSLGFAVERIQPADAPEYAILAGLGTRFRISRAPAGTTAGGRLWLPSSSNSTGQTATSPGGTTIIWESASSRADQPNEPVAPTIAAPPMGDRDWQQGRAGMLYRDLIPGRFGGRIIASHIRIPGGGQVADYVHFHDVAFQMIFCRAGWVRVVYEDQGEPFVMRSGDCVLQPAKIRHRVLECSDELEVVEVSGPADHATYGGQPMQLPNREDETRVFGRGQRFCRYRSDPGLDNTEPIDLGIGRASGDAIEAHVLCTDTAEVSTGFTFGFVLQGTLELTLADGSRHTLDRDAAFAVPADQPASVAGLGDRPRWLRVRVPSIR